MPKEEAIGRFFLTVAIVATLLLAGCGQLGGKKDKGSGIPELYIGTEGIDAFFVPESVPAKVVAGSSLDLLLLISNKGAVNADLSKTTVVVRDARGGYFEFESPIIKLNEPKVRAALESVEPVPLQGKALNGVGSISSLTVTANAKPLSEDEETKETGFQAQVCYSYETRLTANVCIDTSSTSSPDFKKERKPCDMEKAVLLQSQGAPVAIKKIEVSKRVDKTTDGFGKEVKVVKPVFNIFISNIGNGDITDPDDPYSYCVPKNKGGEKGKDEAGRLKINTVKIKTASLMGKDLECEMEKTLTNSLASDFVVCEYTGNDIAVGSGTFATPLSVVLSYGYSSTSAPVPVKVNPPRKTNKA